MNNAGRCRSTDREDEAESPIRGKPHLRQGATNVFAFVPCPLKVRFKADFQDFLDRHNASASRPLFCPNIVDGPQYNLGTELRYALSEEDLPDVLVTTGLSSVFSTSFRRRFLDSGLYQGLTKPECLSTMPESYRHIAQDRNIGFLAFGSWSLIADMSVAQDMATPGCWADLAKPEFRGLLAAPGHHDEFCGTNVLRVIHERVGMDGVRQFATNVTVLKHFSEIMKGIDSSLSGRAPFNLLPSAVSAQMPSRKRAITVPFSDGPLLSPLLLFVKQGRIENCRPVLDYFWGERFQSVIGVGGFLAPGQMDWRADYTFPDWNTLLTKDYASVSNELTSAFFKWFGTDLKPAE